MMHGQETGGARVWAAIALAVLAWQSAVAAPAKSHAVVAGDDGLTLREVDTPAPAAGQVLVKVYAAALNPVDWKRRTPIPGSDVAGVIDSVGAGVTAWKPGDAVVARTTGGYAEYALASVDEVIAKPASFTFEEASGIPVAGIAGYRAAYEAKIKPGQRVAVIGAAGGAGSTAVQAARAQGAKVIASGHSSQAAYLKTLGVDEFVAYDKEDVAAKIRDVDVVVNTVDSQAQAALGYVKRGGYFTSIAGGPGDARCAEAGVTCVIIAAGVYHGLSYGEALRALAALAGQGKYRVYVSKAFPLAEATAAQTLARTSDTIGKIVLDVDPKAKGR